MKFRCNSVPNGAKLFPELKQHYLPDPKAAAAAPTAVGVRVVSLTALTFQPLHASKTGAASKVRSLAYLNWVQIVLEMFLSENGFINFFA